MKIIGLCGFIGSGKDTVAAHLIENKGYNKLSFGGAVKDIISILFDLDREMLEGLTVEHREEREKPNEWWSNALNIPDLSPRLMMVKVATNLFRDNFHQDIWTKIVEKQLYKHNKIVITDCRFKNEIEMLKANGGKLIYIKRDEPSWFNEYKNGIDNEEAMKIHISEREWIRSTFDIVIENDSSIEELIEKIDKIINHVHL